MILAGLLSGLCLTSTTAADLTNDGAIEVALANNLELRVAALEIDRANSRLRWSGRLSNPELGLSGASDFIGENEDEGGFEIAFSQRFPVTSRLKDEKEVRKRDVELAEIEFQIRQRQLAFEVDKAWIQFRASRRAAQASSRLLEVNDGIREFLDGRVEAGEASSLDVVQASLNGELLKQQLGIAKASVVDAGGRMKQLIGMEPDRAIGIVEGAAFSGSPPPANLDMGEVLRNRPDYSLILRSEDLGDAQLKLAMAQRWDDIAVKVFLEHDSSVDEPEGIDRNTFAGVGISIPLPLRNKNQQAIEEAEIDIERARRARDAMIFSIHSELRRVLAARSAAYRLASSARGESLPLAKKNLEEFEIAQQNGQASLLQVQQAQSQLLQLENAALELQKNYDLLDAEVRFLAGTYPIPSAGAKGGASK
ncbi:MAG: TolC family protein [Verrucomicrobiales bacterium]